MRFVASEIGLINVDQIERIQKQKNGDALLILKDENVRAMLTFDDLEASLLPVVPNVSGIRAMNFVIEEDETHSPYFLPIIGWRVDSVGAHAIMAHYEDEATYLVYPDGQVQSYEFGMMFDSVEGAVADYRERQKPRV